jgi:hypothetical protein
LRLPANATAAPAAGRPLAARDCGQFPEWLRLQCKRLGLLILGGLFASVLLLF